MGRPREHDESTRSGLLAAAEELLSRGEPLSVRAVADASGTTTRAVYSLFGNMDGLHQALLGRAFELLGDRLLVLSATRDPAADLVRAGLDGFRGFVFEHPNLFHLAFEQIVPGLEPTSEVGAVMRRSLRALIAFVERCADAGLLGGRSVKEVAWQFHALCQGLASIERKGWLGRVDSEPVAMWRDALETFVAGLAQPPRKKRKPTSGSRRSGASR